MAVCPGVTRIKSESPVKILDGLLIILHMPIQSPAMCVSPGIVGVNFYRLMEVGEVGGILMQLKMDEPASTIGPGIFWVHLDGVCVIYKCLSILSQCSVDLSTLGVEAIRGSKSDSAVDIPQSQFRLFSQAVDTCPA